MASFLIANAKPSLLLGLDVMSMPYRAYLQGAIWSGGYWWVCSAQDGISGAGGNQSNHISKFDSKGRYLGRMTCVGSGHGSAFAMVGNDVVLGWDESGSGRKIRRIEWRKGDTVKRSEASVVNTGTGEQAWIPLPLDGDNFTIRRKVSGPWDQFSLRRWSSPSVIRKQMRVKPLKPTNADEGTFQGAFSWGADLFVLYAATTDKPQRLAQYKWPSGSGSLSTTVAPVSVLDITEVGLDKSFSSKEPEGVCLYNGKLVFGQRLGPASRRVFRQFIFDASAANPTPTPPPSSTNPAWPPKPVVPPPRPDDKC